MKDNMIHADLKFNPQWKKTTSKTAEFALIYTIKITYL